MDIIEFLTGCLDADEKRLRDGWYGDVYWQALNNAAALGGWTAARQIGLTVTQCDQITDAASALVKERLQGWQRQEAKERLADIAAKRRTMARHAGLELAPGKVICLGCGYYPGDINPAYDLDECPELRDLAAIYADRPDYQERWKP